MILFSRPDKGDQRIRIKKKNLSVRIKRSIGNLKSKLSGRMQRKYKVKKTNKRKDIRRGTKRRGRRSFSQKRKKIKTRIKSRFWNLSM